MRDMFQKITALFLSLCLITGMTDLPVTAFGSVLDDADIVATDKEALEIGFSVGDSVYGVTDDLALPLTGVSGSAITWLSDTPEVIANDGAVTRPDADVGDTGVALTATITYGEAEDTKAFTMTVLKEEGELWMLMSPMSTVVWVGNGDVGNPYQVSSAAHLDEIRTRGMSAHYIQTEDIDLTGINWTPIGDSANRFTGTYDGGGFTISDLNISSTLDNVGLFGVIGDGGILQDLTLENASVSSAISSGYVGALVGFNYGSVSQCSSTGLVTGGSGAYIGGLVGIDIMNTITLDSVAITTPATKMDYTVGEPVDIAGLTVTGTYAGGNTAVLPVTAGHITGFDSSVPVAGQVLTITFGGNATTYTVDINALVWQGSGIEGDPYEVSSPAHLLAVRENLSAHYIQTTDIDLSGIPNWTPIWRDWSTPFTGSYDGGGHTLSNLTINNSSLDPVGLFAYVGSGGILENIRLENVNVSSSSHAIVGALVGVNELGSVSNCSVSGSLSIGGNGGGLAGNNYGTVMNSGSSAAINGGAGSRTGGLVGANAGTITGSTSSGPMNAGANSSAGGLVYLNSGTITGSSSSAAVSVGTSSYAGGLAGQTEGTDHSINNSHSTGNVIGSGNNLRLGGLIGSMDGHSSGIINCYSTGNVIGNGGNSRTGGLIGYMEGDLFTIANSYSVGSVSGGGDNSRTGGLIGHIEGPDFSIADCYSTGDVSGSGAGAYAGGLIGRVQTSDISITNCYSTGGVSAAGGATSGGLIALNTSPAPANASYYLETAAASSDGGTALTAEQMKQRANFEGWDFDTVWYLSDNIPSPVLRWQLLDITYHANGGSGAAPAETPKLAGETFPAAANTFTPPSGKQFKHWNTESEGTGTSYGAGDTVTMPAGPLNLYAIWENKPGGGSSGGGGGRDTPSTPAAPEYKAEVKVENGVEATLPVKVDKDAKAASVDAGPQSFAQGGTVITMPSIPDVGTYSVSIPVPELSATDGQSTLTIDTERGSIILPSNMLTGVSGISGNKAGISMGQGDKDSLPEEVRDAIGDRPLISLTLSIDGRQTDWSNPDAPVTVSIPYAPTAQELADPENITVWYIDGAGNAVEVPDARFDPATGTVVFPTTHFSLFAVVYQPDVVTARKVIRITIGSSTAEINSRAYNLDAAPYIDAAAGRTLVPIRFVGEALGAEVAWDTAAKQITVKDAGKEIVLTVGSSRVLVDGATRAIDCPPAMLPSGRTLAPLRFIGETLGAKVHYDAAAKRITITR